VAQRVLETVKKGAHVLAEGSLIGSTYERSKGKVRKLRRPKKPPGPFAQKLARLREPEHTSVAFVSVSDNPEASQESGDAPYCSLSKKGRGDVRACFSGRHSDRKERTSPCGQLA